MVTLSDGFDFMRYVGVPMAVSKLNGRTCVCAQWLTHHAATDTSTKDDAELFHTGRSSPNSNTRSPPSNYDGKQIASVANIPKAFSESRRGLK